MTASSVIDYWAYNRVPTGNEHGSDHAMVRARLRLRIKAARNSNRPAKPDTAKKRKPHRKKICAWSYGTVLRVWRSMEKAEGHLERTRRQRRGGVTGGTIALVEQAHLMIIQRALNHRKLSMQITRARRRGRNIYWQAIAEETERVGRQ